MSKINEEIKSEMKVMVENTEPTEPTLVKDLLRFQYRILKDKIWCNSFPIKQIENQSQQIITHIYGGKDKQFTS